MSCADHKTLRLALYKHPKWGIEMVYVDREREPKEMVRISDWISVSFVLRDPEEIVPEQIKAIDAQIAQATADFAKALEGLKTQKANLLALTQRVVE
jgi:hypothetical protein